jgi:hypothetical protein
MTGMNEAAVRALGDPNAPGVICNPGAPDIPYKQVSGEITRVEVSTPVLAEGMVLSVTIGATLNLGNYSNAKIDVTATDATIARKYFAEEVEETVKLVQMVLKKVIK